MPLVALVLGLGVLLGLAGALWLWLRAAERARAEALWSQAVGGVARPDELWSPEAGEAAAIQVEAVVEAARVHAPAVAAAAAGRLAEIRLRRGEIPQAQAALALARHQAWQAQQRGEAAELPDAAELDALEGMILLAQGRLEEARARWAPAERGAATVHPRALAALGQWQAAGMAEATASLPALEAALRDGLLADASGTAALRAEFEAARAERCWRELAAAPVQAARPHADAAVLPNDPWVRRAFAAAAATERGEAAALDEWAEIRVEWARREGPASPGAIRATLNEAAARADAGQSEAALALWAEAEGLLRRTDRADHPDLGQLRLERALLRQRLGQHAEALADLDGARAAGLAAQGDLARLVNELRTQWA